MRTSIHFALAPLTLSGIVLCAGSTIAQELSPTEQEIVANVEERADEAVALLERTVNINSGTMNPEGVRQVAEVLAPEFEAMGFETEWVALPDSLNRSGHLIARRSGSRGERLLLIGHLDTVFEEDSPFQRFERLNDSIARGPGAADMKGGDIVIVEALRALHEAGALDGTTITVVLTGDEENPGRPLSISRSDLIGAARNSDIALGFEGGSFEDGTHYGVIARRSSTGWKLTVTGRPAHSSGIFAEGVGAGAIYEASRILNGFYEELRGEEYLTFNPGVILGGTEVTYDDLESRGTAFGKSNVIAETVIATGDIRTISDEQLERTRDRMREIVSQNLPQTSAEIEFTDGYPSMPPTDENQAILDVYDEVSRALGHGPVVPNDPGSRGAADISFVAPIIPGIGGLGPLGDGSHTVEETIDLRSLPRAAQRAALLIYRLTTE